MTEIRRLTREAAEYAKTRGISTATLGKMQAGGGEGSFGGPPEHALIFQYFDSDGECVNWKARSVSGKKFTAMKGGRQIAYNWANVCGGNMDAIYIAEGEIDACSLVEAGIPADQVLSVPGGAPAESGGTDGKRYQWLYDALAGGLKAASRYILCTDNDGPGHALRHDLVAVLGAAKSWFVDWPHGVKDANDFLLLHGPSDLHGYVTGGAQPWPVVGLYTLDQLPEPPPLELWRTGFAEIGDRIHLAPTTLSVVTGMPGHGKSILWQQIWFQIAQRYGVRIALFSAETRVKPFVRRMFRQCFHGALEKHLTPAQCAEADDFVRAHFQFLGHPHERPTMAWLLETIEVAAVRHHCRAVLVDPWNKIESGYDPRAMTETTWIADCLDKFIEMARGLNIHIQIIAHPAKPDATARKAPPDLYSISGSAHWNNRVDQGFVVHRSKMMDGGVRQTAARLACLKSRFEELGFPSEFDLNLNLQTGIFECSGKAGAQLKLVGDDGWGGRYE